MIDLEENKAEDTEQETIQVSAYLPLEHFIPVKRKPYPSIGAAFGLLGILLGASLIAGFVAGVISALWTRDYLFLFIFIGYIIAFGLALWIGIIFRHTASFSFLWGHWALWPLLLIFCLGFLFMREPLLNLVPDVGDYKGLYEGYEISNPFIFLLVVLAAPVFEELLFRGIILDGFLKRYSPKRSILLSSLIFGIAHLNPGQFVNAFMLGIIIGVVYWKTQSLWLCMFFHFVNNLGAGLLSYMYSVTGKHSIYHWMEHDIRYFLFYSCAWIVTIGLSCLIWFLLRRSGNRLAMKNEVSPVEMGVVN